jgi:hypothetical protein
MQFVCTSCGERHDLSDLSLGADWPVQWELLSPQDRERSLLGEEQCIIESGEGLHHFVRTCLEIPVRGTGAVFTWGVWVSLSERSFEEMSEHWEDPERTTLGPYFGWLCTTIPEYPDTVFLTTRVHQRAVGLRPTVELEPTEHPLAVHQREGIEPAELQEIVRKVLHPEDAGC